MAILNTSKFLKLCENNPETKIISDVNALMISSSYHSLLIKDITPSFANEILTKYGIDNKRLALSVVKLLCEYSDIPDQELIRITSIWQQN